MKDNTKEKNKKAKKPKEKKVPLTPEQRKKTAVRWVLDIICIILGSTSYSMGLTEFKNTSKQSFIMIK